MLNSCFLVVNLYAILQKIDNWPKEIVNKDKGKRGKKEEGGEK